MKKFILPLTSLLAVSAFSIPQAFAASDVYDNYAELSSHYHQGTDYTIETQSKTDDVIVLAIHGGRIEKGTDQLAKAIAQDDHSYYIFNALIYEDSNNDGRNDLHLTSTHFDEPTALKMTTQKHKVVSIHGAAGDDPIVYMGGRKFNEQYFKQIVSCRF
ncbi:MAG: poly-gamma-glutamate hydrolase family protein [Thermoactinomyces sp.]